MEKRQAEWARDTAASRMITNVPITNAEMSVGKAALEFKKRIRGYEFINYVYVTDNKGKLVGVFSIKALFHLPPKKKIGEIMDRRVVFVHPHTHQERVALLAIEHDLSAIPVVDKERRLLGVVPSDAILDILHSESIEDSLRSAGIRKFADPIRDIMKASVLVYFEKRVPWLVLGLFGGILAAVIVSSFEEALKVELLLAAFIPMVVYISDAVGTQTEAIFIRSLALIQKLDFKAYIVREIWVVCLISIVLGVLSFMIPFLLYNSALLSVIVGLSVATAIIAAAIIALILPWVFYKLKYDPALPSGPFATMITDIVSVFIYFVIASTLVKELL
ncbi:MAG: magnesium transporter [Candidatus Bilamarchaeaceae archaeon]